MLHRLLSRIETRPNVVVLHLEGEVALDSVRELERIVNENLAPMISSRGLVVNLLAGEYVIAGEVWVSSGAGFADTCGYRFFRTFIDDRKIASPNFQVYWTATNLQARIFRLLGFKDPLLIYSSIDNLFSNHPELADTAQ